jgi:mycofactocin precursor
MDDTTTVDTLVDEAPAAASAEVTETEAVDEELLIEEVSIDGMCGVY